MSTGLGLSRSGAIHRWTTDGHPDSLSVSMPPGRGSSRVLRRVRTLDDDQRTAPPKRYLLSLDIRFASSMSPPVRMAFRATISSFASASEAAFAFDNSV
jgi:hypothetical protein